MTDDPLEPRDYSDEIQAGIEALAATIDKLKFERNRDNLKMFLISMAMAFSAYGIAWNASGGDDGTSRAATAISFVLLALAYILPTPFARQLSDAASGHAEQPDGEGASTPLLERVEGRLEKYPQLIQATLALMAVIALVLAIL